MTKELRQPQFNGFIGCPGGGKSFFISKQLKALKRNVIVYKEHLNIDDDALDWLKLVDYKKYRGGKVKISSMNIKYKDFILWVYNNVRDAVVVIDDATIYERNQISDELNRLLAMRRHIGVDMWLVYHGFTGFPIDQFRFLNYIVLFNTTDQPDYKKNKIPKADVFNKAKQVIQARQHIDPTLSQYKNAKEHMYTPVIINMRA